MNRLLFSSDSFPQVFLCAHNNAVYFIRITEHFPSSDIAHSYRNDVH